MRDLQHFRLEDFGINSSFLLTAFLLILFISLVIKEKDNEKLFFVTRYILLLPIVSYLLSLIFFRISLTSPFHLNVKFENTYYYLVLFVITFFTSPILFFISFKIEKIKFLKTVWFIILSINIISMFFHNYYFFEEQNIIKTETKNILLDAFKVSPAASYVRGMFNPTIWVIGSILSIVKLKKHCF